MILRLGTAINEPLSRASVQQTYDRIIADLTEAADLLPETQLNNFQAAIDNFRKALELTELRSEQLFLSKRLRDSE